MEPVRRSKSPALAASTYVLHWCVRCTYPMPHQCILRTKSPKISPSKAQTVPFHLLYIRCWKPTQLSVYFLTSTRTRSLKFLQKFFVINSNCYCLVSEHGWRQFIRFGSDVCWHACPDVHALLARAADQSSHRSKWWTQMQHTCQKLIRGHAPTMVRKMQLDVKTRNVAVRCTTCTMCCTGAWTSQLESKLIYTAVMASLWLTRNMPIAAWFCWGASWSHQVRSQRSHK